MNNNIATAFYDAMFGESDYSRDKHINKRTGEVTEVPRGIDPGWHTNPGLSRQKNIENFLAEAVDTAPLDLARVAVADLMRDSEFKAHLLG
ncbi:MAG: hypothetical protein COB35_13485, partial [Gammaproteobacteria bacterium]